jgi:diketogulonate reductase-like aldo/keto reductase
LQTTQNKAVKTTNQEEMDTAIFSALDAGYRLIDTATMYQNEQLIGNSLQSYFEQHAKKWVPELNCTY